jgi:hypothetical protein
MPGPVLPAGFLFGGTMEPRTFYYDVVDVIRDDPAREKMTCVAISTPDDELLEIAVRGIFELDNPGSRLTLEDILLAKCKAQGIAFSTDKFEPMLEIHAGGEFATLAEDRWA